MLNTIFLQAIGLDGVFLYLRPMVMVPVSETNCYGTRGQLPTAGDERFGGDQAISK